MARHGDGLKKERYLYNTKCIIIEEHLDAKGIPYL